jgi:hypothetical protein
MGENASTSPARAYFASVTAAGIAAQVFIILVAFRHGIALQTWLGSLGVAPPFVTSSFLSTYHWWPLVPIMAAILAIDVGRRPGPPRRYGVVVLLLTVLAAVLLQAWTLSAWMEPLLDMIKRVS